MAKKLRNETEQSVLDPETGEYTTVTTSKTYSISTPPENFYMTFIDSVKGLFNLTSAVEIKVMIYFCTLAEYNTGTVYLTSLLRKNMCEELNITSQQITNATRALRKKNLLSGEKGTYFLNSSIFWKGTTSARRVALKNRELTLKVSFDDKEDIKQK